MSEETKLLPKGSIIVKSPTTRVTYHVLKFYAHYYKDQEAIYVSDHKHLIGNCVHCRKFQ